MLTINDLSYEYYSGKSILQKINLSIDECEPIAIIGENGAGKSTLMKQLNGLLTPTKGQVVIDGVDVASKSVPEWSEVVGYVFQNPDNQLFLDSVRKEFEFGPNQIHLKKELLRQRVLKISNLVGLEDELETHPFDLSPTQKKFCAIGSVLMMEPKILILDEPTCGLDLKEKEKLQEIVKQLYQNNILCITISHDMEFVAENFKRIIVMKGGRIVLDGTRKEVFSYPEILEECFVELPIFVELSRNVGLDEISFTVEEFIAQIQTAVTKNEESRR